MFRLKSHLWPVCTVCRLQERFEKLVKYVGGRGGEAPGGAPGGRCPKCRTGAHRLHFGVHFGMCFLLTFVNSSRKAHFLRKAVFREGPVFYGISTFDTFWGPHFLGFCRTVDKSEEKPLTKMGSKMKPVCNSTALWAPAVRGTSRGLAPPAPYVFYELFEALLEAAKGASRPEVRS